MFRSPHLRYETMPPAHALALQKYYPTLKKIPYVLREAICNNIFTVQEALELSDKNIKIFALTEMDLLTPDDYMMLYHRKSLNQFSMIVGGFLNTLHEIDITKPENLEGRVDFYKQKIMDNPRANAAIHRLIRDIRALDGGIPDEVGLGTCDLHRARYANQAYNAWLAEQKPLSGHRPF